MQDRPWYARWPAGLPVSLDYPSVPVYKLLESSARKYPDREALVFPVYGTSMTYAELWEKARRFAAALSRLGVRRGDVVCIQLSNSPHYAIAYYGLMLAGAVFTPSHPMQSPLELRRQLVDSGAETLIVPDTFMPTVTGVRGQTRVKNVIVSGEQELVPPFTPVHVVSWGPRTYSFQQLLLGSPPKPPPLRLNPERDIAHLAYTGGTTGVSKGVVLTHKAVVTNTLQFAHWTAGGRPYLERNGVLQIVDHPGPHPGGDWELPVTPGESTMLVAVPWSHAMGTVGYLNVPVYLGATIVCHPRFDAGAYLADIEKYRVDVFGGAPALLKSILDHPDAATADLSSVKQVRCGAAPLPRDVYEGIRSLIPRAVLTEGYGLTEVAMGATANPACRSGTRKPGSVGIPVFDTDVKIVDLDDPSIEIGFDELGEVCITGPQVMRGYHGRPDDTAAVLRGGWVHTGDIGRLDEDGYLYIVDRKKDMLIYNGYNVYPRELEEHLRSHPAVADCVVVGKPDPTAGEIPKAFVVLKPGAEADPQDIMTSVAERVSPYKKVREVEFIEAIPVNLAGKPLRRELRELERERARAAAEAAAGDNDGGAGGADGT